MICFNCVIVNTLQKLDNKDDDDDDDNNNNNNNNNSICKALGIETRDKWNAHMPKPVYEVGDVTVLWNQAIYTDREVTANRPDIIIKNMHTDRCGNTRRQKCSAKGSGKEV